MSGIGYIPGAACWCCQGLWKGVERHLARRYVLLVSNAISGDLWEDMRVETYIKESFVVIGKEGSTLDGEGFIQRLWMDADSHFGEAQHLAKKMKMDRSAAYGELCLISRIHSIHGKISEKGFTLLEQIYLSADRERL